MPPLGKRFILQERSQEEKEDRLDWLIFQVEHNENIFQVYKALVCLKNLCSDWSVVLQLY